MNIQNITVNNDYIIYKINNKDFTVKLNTKVIDFINQYKIWLYNLAQTKTIESENESIFNSIESNKIKKMVISRATMRMEEEYYYEHKVFNFDDYKLKQDILNILQTKHPELKIYYNNINDFPLYWYIKHGYKVYGDFNNNWIFEYDATSIIQNLETWKNSFEQLYYFNPAENKFHFKYYKNNKNEIKSSFDEMIEEMKKEFNINS